MKKATLTIGLLTLVMVLTSFTTPQATITTVDNNTNAFIDGNGGQDVGGHRKRDYNGNTTIKTLIVSIDGNGGQDVGGWRKRD